MLVSHPGVQSGLQLIVAKLSKGVSKLLLAKRASSKQVLLARRQIYWPRAIGPALISTPAVQYNIYEFLGAAFGAALTL